MKTDNKLDLYEAIETLYYLLAQPLFLHNTYSLLLFFESNVNAICILDRVM